MEKWTLPAGWTWGQLSDLVTSGPNNGYSGPVGEHGTETLKLSATTSGEMILDDTTTKRLAEIVPDSSDWFLEPGDVLIQRANSLQYLGATAVYFGPSQRYVYPDLMMRVRVSDPNMRTFLWKWLNSAHCRAYFQAHATGTAGNMPKINGTVVRDTPTPVPPLTEQNRIVAKLNTLQSHARRAREALAELPNLIDHLRQRVLAAAFRGDLTADWREAHPDVEPASVLLERVRAERRARWEAAELARMTSKGRLPMGGRWKERYTEPTAVDPAGLPALPRGWVWTSVSAVSECLDHMRQPITKKDRLPGEVPYYGANGLVDHVQDHLFDEDLVLVTEDETFYGRTKPIAYRVSGKSWVNNHAHVLRSLAPIPPDLLCYQLMYYKVEPWLSGTTGRAKLTQGALLSLPLALPGYDELIEIGRRVASQLRHAELLLAQAGNLGEAIQEMDRGLLTRAFRGELVPQDPNDEPASVLLERLRARRETPSSVTRRPRARRDVAQAPAEEKVPPEPQDDDAEPVPTLDPEPPEPETMAAPETVTPGAAPSWTLDAVEVWNFRSIAHLDLPLHPRLNLFLGDNAHGKTTVLDAISCCLVPILKRLPNVDGFNLRSTDIRRTADSTSPGIVLRARTRAGVEWDDDLARDKAAGTATELKATLPRRRDRQDLHAALDTAITQVQRGVEGATLPVVVYYGVDRAVTDLGGKAGAPAIDSRAMRFQALAGALEAGSRATGFSDWFYRMQFEELTAQSERGDLTWRHPELDAVRTAIIAAIPSAKALRMVGRPPQLVVDWTGPEERVETLPFAQMSGGYRTMLAMVGDIARRMVQANPHLGTRSEAIILIDEVDLHLHPKWQLQVVPSLLAAFPNAQFILTTHSEQVISTVEPESVFVLKRDATGLQVERPSSTFGATADRISRQVMGVPGRPPGTQRDLDLYWDLIESDRGEGDEARALRAKLEASFKGEDPEMVRADMEIRRRRVLGARRSTS